MIGFQTARPRTPAVYERKTAWRKYQDADFVAADQWRDNCPSVKEALGKSQSLQEHFRKK